MADLKMIYEQDAPLDPLKGTVLWKKEAASGVQLFGDDSYVFIVETNDKAYDVIRETAKALKLDLSKMK